MSKVLEDCVGVYFIELGKFDTVKECFKFPEGYDFSTFAKNPTVYKFGKTTNIASRIKDHIANFKKCNIKLNKENLKLFFAVPGTAEDLKKVEDTLHKTFSDMFRNFPFTGIDDTRRKELIFFHDDEFEKIKELCNNLISKKEEPVKEIRKVELIDTLENVTKYYNGWGIDWDRTFNFENTTPILKLDFELLDYSLYCRELGEIKPYLYTREYNNILTIVLYITTKNNSCKNYYKVKLIKNENNLEMPAVDNNYLLGKCSINQEPYFVIIPRHP
jgi:hypothetical protein